MKLQERQALKEFPEKELKARLEDCRTKLFKLRLSNSMAPMKNPLQIRHLRREQARLLTWLRQKEIQQKAKA